MSTNLGLGLIMAIAFCGPLFSSVTIMNMLSFFMVFAVLFDTFIIRSLVVPGLMGLLMDGNWWPGKVPKVSKRYELSQDLTICNGNLWVVDTGQDPK